jgi:hypothetical protein
LPGVRASRRALRKGRAVPVSLPVRRGTAVRRPPRRRFAAGWHLDTGINALTLV